MSSERLRLPANIIDSLTLSNTLDMLSRAGGHYCIRRFDIGATKNYSRHAEIVVTAPDTETLERILHVIQQHGAERATGEARLEPAPKDGVLPEGFYATTNLETSVSFGGRWIP